MGVPRLVVGLESEYDRVTGADHDRMITTPALSQRLSVIADAVRHLHLGEPVECGRAVQQRRAAVLAAADTP